MTTAKAKRPSGNAAKPGRALKIVLAYFLIELVIILPADGRAQNKEPVREDPPSNEEFLRGSLKSVLARTFVDFPKDKSKLLLLKAEGKHPANWLLEDELISYLVSSKYQVGLHLAEPKTSLMESRSLFYRIIEMSLDYPRIRRRGLLGKRMVTRQASLNLSFRMEDDASGKVLWTGKGKDEKSDLVKRSLVKSLNNQSYPFLSPDLPEDSQTKFIEPALVVAVVGGLIYLFFANR